MPTTLLDLPTELQFAILSHCKPRHLFVSVRLVSTRFQALVEDIFRSEILPTLRIDLNVCDVGNHQEYLPSKNVQLQYHFSAVGESNADVMNCSLRAVEPKARRERVLRQLRQPNVIRHAMQMSISSSYVIATKDNSWFEHPVWRGSPKQAGVGEMLMLDWKKMLVKYFKATTRVLEDVAENRAGGKSMFPLY